MTKTLEENKKANEATNESVNEATNKTAKESEVVTILNVTDSNIESKDVELLRTKLEYEKYDTELAYKIAQWRIGKELKHQKFMRITEAVEKIIITGMVGGALVYNRKQGIELAKHKVEYGNE